VYTLQLIKASD